MLAELDLSLEEATNLLLTNGELEEGQTILDVYMFVYDLELDLYYYNLTPITEENLQQLLDDYGLTLDELKSLLAENDDSLENYEFIEDLELAVEIYLYGPVFMDELFDVIGLTADEIDRLLAHLETLNFEDEAFLNKLLELSERMMAFEDFESADELTAEQIAELLDIFSQLLHLFELDTKFFLVNDSEKKPISLETLMTMTELKGYNLLIELYNLQGVFLADILLTADMFGSEIIKETGKDLKTVEKVVSESDTKPVTKTVKGAKLPKTASDYVANTAAGLAVALIGFVLYRRFKATHA